MGARDPSEESPSDRVTASEPADTAGTRDGSGGDDAAGTDAAGDDGARVDVVWFPSDDDYVVVAAGDGDRAVNFHRYGRVGVALVGALFAALGVFVLHGYVTATTALAWPVSGVVFAIGAVAIGAYVYWRWDPDAPPEVVARDEPVGRAREEFDFEE
jgi:hypothetical protein